MCSAAPFAQWMTTMDREETEGEKGDKRKGEEEEEEGEHNASQGKLISWHWPHTGSNRL